MGRSLPVATVTRSLLQKSKLGEARALRHVMFLLQGRLIALAAD
jgi:hypothetical protein